MEYSNRLSQLLSVIFFHCNMNYISWLFSNLCTNVFQNAKDIANGTIRILYTHVNNGSIIRLTIKGSVNFHPSFSKLFLNIIRKRNISSSFSNIGCVNNCFIFVNFFAHFLSHLIFQNIVNMEFNLFAKQTQRFIVSFINSRNIIWFYYQ